MSHHWGVPIPCPCPIIGVSPSPAPCPITGVSPPPAMSHRCGVPIPHPMSSLGSYGAPMGLWHLWGFPGLWDVVTGSPTSFWGHVVGDSETSAPDTVVLVCAFTAAFVAVAIVVVVVCRCWKRCCGRTGEDMGTGCSGGGIWTGMGWGDVVVEMGMGTEVLRGTDPISLWLQPRTLQQ